MHCFQPGSFVVVVAVIAWRVEMFFLWVGETNCQARWHCQGVVSARYCWTCALVEVGQMNDCDVIFILWASNGECTILHSI